MSNAKGFTLIELMIVIVVFLVFFLIVFKGIVDNRGWTEERAMASANSYIKENGITVKRLTCAGDSDGDGYGTCNMVTEAGEKITLNCPVNYVSTKIFGASMCKEVFINFNLMQ